MAWEIHHNELYANPWRWYKVLWDTNAGSYEASQKKLDLIPASDYAAAGINAASVRAYMAGWNDADINSAMQAFFGSGVSTPVTTTPGARQTEEQKAAAAKKNEFQTFMEENSWALYVAGGILLFGLVIMSTKEGGKG